MVVASASLQGHQSLMKCDMTVERGRFENPLKTYAILGQKSPVSDKKRNEFVLKEKKKERNLMWVTQFSCFGIQSLSFEVTVLLLSCL